MPKQQPHVVIKGDSNGIFIIVDGVKVAERGTDRHAKTWVALEPGWTVRDVNFPEKIEIEYNGVRVH